MAEPTSPDGWSVVLALASGVLAFIGGVAGSWFTQRWQTKADKEKRREEKFEALMGALYDHRDWLKALGNSRAFDSAPPVGSSPMARVRAIAAVYFKSFQQALIKLDVAADHYELWTFPAGQERKNKGKLELVTLEAGQKAYAPYATTWKEIVERLENLAINGFRE